MTVVGNFPHAARGQLLRFAGHWDTHAKHGTQLKAIRHDEVVPQSPDAIAAYLSSVIPGNNHSVRAVHGCLIVDQGIHPVTCASMHAHQPAGLFRFFAFDLIARCHGIRMLTFEGFAGVGPFYACSMVEQYGNSILTVLDSSSAAAKLAKCRGIGSKFAAMIKQHWDESRGVRLQPSVLIICLDGHKHSCYITPISP